MAVTGFTAFDITPGGDAVIADKTTLPGTAGQPAARVGDIVFTTADEHTLMCIDATPGAEVWRHIDRAPVWYHGVGRLAADTSEANNYGMPLTTTYPPPTEAGKQAIFGPTGSNPNPTALASDCVVEPEPFDTYVDSSSGTMETLLP